MTHEPKPRTKGKPGGPEDDHDLPDADSIPVVATAAEVTYPDPEDA